MKRWARGQFNDNDRVRQNAMTDRVALFFCLVCVNAKKSEKKEETGGMMCEKEDL